MSEKLECLKCMAIVLPSLDPNEKFKGVVEELIGSGFEHIVIVNDGSDAEHLHWFEEAAAHEQCTVLTHEVNRGKGRGLKDGFAYVAEKLPEVYQSVCTDFGAPLRESDVSMEVCYRILEHLPDVPVDAMPVLKSCNLLNESCRNSLAHQLTAVTAEQITAACGMQPAQLLNQVGKLIASIYPECDPALFTIYKRCGDYIKSKIL